MPTFRYSSVLVLLCYIAVVHGKYTPICQPTSSKNAFLAPKLPKIPTAFSTSVEANIVNRNYTTILKEYYDFAANRGSLESTFHGKTFRQIYNYNEDEAITINGSQCSVWPIDKLRQHCAFSFFGPSNSTIESVADLFKFAKKYNENYLGVKTVRGVKCNHWRACIATNFSSFYMDYYFSVPGWRTSWQSPNSTVVRAVINGTSINARCTGNGTWKFENSTHDFYHVYDFYDFRPVSPDPSNFQLPEGYYCLGLKGANKTLPVVPPVFSMELESVSARRNHVTNWLEVYDFKKNLFMMKFPYGRNRELGPVIWIHDFNTGIGYNISSPTDQNPKGCMPFHITNKSYDATDAGSHVVRMKTTQELFNKPLGNNSAPLVYKGTTSVRGIEADVWISEAFNRSSRRYNKSHDVVIEWYFSKPSWNVSSGSAPHQHQVPLKIAMYSPRGNFELNMFNFDAEPVQPTTFDIKPCFPPDQQVFIQFTLKGGHHNYGRWKGFMLAVTQSISTAANVSLIRVNGIRLSNDKLGNTVVTFILLNKTALEVKSVGLQAALTALTKSVQSGKFEVKFNNEIVRGVRSSFYVGYRSGPITSTGGPTVKPSGKPQPGGDGSSKKKGVPGGAVAGIAFVMLALGIVGGLGIAHVIMKRRGTSLFSYQRQE